MDMKRGRGRKKRKKKEQKERKRKEREGREKEGEKETRGKKDQTTPPSWHIQIKAKGSIIREHSPDVNVNHYSFVALTRCQAGRPQFKGDRARLVEMQTPSVSLNNGGGEQESRAPPAPRRQVIGGPERDVPRPREGREGVAPPPPRWGAAGSRPPPTPRAEVRAPRCSLSELGAATEACLAQIRSGF